MPKILNRSLKLAGSVYKVGTPYVTVLEWDESDMVRRAKGATLPTDGDTGYATGCQFIVTSGGTGSTVYINEGTSSSALFKALNGTSGAATVTATKTVTAQESGKTFFLNSSTEFASTLPAPAAGLRYTFIVTAAPSGASYTIITASSANIIKGSVYTSDVNSGTDADFETSGGDTISFVDSKAVAGDRVELFCDGTNWFAYGYCTVFDGITITTAS